MPGIENSKFILPEQAFNAEGNELSESLKPVKKSMVSLLHFQLENGEQKSSTSEETEHEIMLQIMSFET